MRLRLSEYFISFIYPALGAYADDDFAWPRSIDWHKASQVSFGPVFDSNLTSFAYVLSLAGSHSTALPAATETAVEAAARVSKGPNKAKPKEPVIKRPSIVTELGSVNYLAIHDAQGMLFLLFL